MIRWLLLGTILSSACAAAAQDRVADARRAKAAEVQRMARAAGLPHPIPRLYFRAHKLQAELEIWGSAKAGDPMRLVRTYNIAGMSGLLGPKLQEGDRQVPEGFYTIDRFNPRSRFLLSLGINYPNALDRLVADKERPGGDIFIHGGTASIGCLAMTDPAIQEIYLLALGARRPIPVHIFPGRMDDAAWAKLERRHASLPSLTKFWKTLRPAWLAFEKTRITPRVRVDARSRTYVLLNPPRR